ncbi:MAG: hypothetical protein QM813_13295 [Verrucomicrobiota bacterium]
MPFEAAFGLQFRLEPVGQGLEIMRVVAGVRFHAGGQRAHRPVGLLRPFFQLHAQMFLHEVAEAKLADAQQAGGQHGVENRAGDELVMFAEQAQIVVRRRA